MGSGSRYSYSGTSSGSQPYAETYNVVPEVLNKDKKDPDIYDKNEGYFSNPTAVSLESAIYGNRVIFNSYNAHGKYTYVMDKNGNIIFGKRYNPNDINKRSPHPTLIGGKNPQVQCAGIIEMSKGKIMNIDNMSGHFKPHHKSLNKVYDVLHKLHESNPSIFSTRFQWRK